MAAAAVELAEWYQRKNRFLQVSMRWMPVASLVLFVPSAISDIVAGETLLAAFLALGALSVVVHLILSPIVRPKNMTRALEASRRAAATPTFTTSFSTPPN